jgi:hypothetical protein
VGDLWENDVPDWVANAFLEAHHFENQTPEEIALILSKDPDIQEIFQHMLTHMVEMLGERASDWE